MNIKKDPMGRAILDYHKTMRTNRPGRASRLSPRRKGSHWTELNKKRCKQLETQGLMTDSGRAALNKN